MKDLLTVNNNVVIPSVYALTIPEFEKLSIKELSFVFFYADHRSSYAAYDDEERQIKLEDDLKSNGMSGDLITVYSALKKIHLHTPKYYEYSQLYNKHLAYTMALEKAEELLGSFIKALSEYYLSKSVSIYELLHFIKMEIVNIFA